jgi:hypothetical protein
MTELEKTPLTPLFRIRDIFVRIRIRIRMNIPDHFSESLEQILGLIIFKFFMWIRIQDPESF